MGGSPKNTKNFTPKTITISSIKLVQMSQNYITLTSQNKPIFETAPQMFSLKNEVMKVSGLQPQPKLNPLWTPVAGLTLSELRRSFILNCFSKEAVWPYL